MELEVSYSLLGGNLHKMSIKHYFLAGFKYHINPIMCQEALDFERSNEGERTESKCRKDKDHDLWYQPGPPAEQESSHVPSLALN